MTKTDCRLCVVAAVLLCHMSPLFSQNLKSFNQNASRSNHTRLSFASPEQAFVLRLNGDRASSGSDGLASGATFMPGIAAHYYVGNWGLGVEYASFSNDQQFDLAAYLKNIQGFTVRDIVSSQWKTRSLLAGISYRASLGDGLYATVNLSAGMLSIKPPSYTIKDKTDGTLIADTYYDTKTTTSADKALFAIKPALYLEWFPGSGAIGVNVHASYLQATGAQEVSAYYRDLSKVRFENASQQEIRTQVVNAPVVETRSKGPVNSLAFGAGIALKIATRQQRQTQGSTFGEKVSAGLQHNPVHRDQGMRHIIAGRLAIQFANANLGIITNESSTDVEFGRKDAIEVLTFSASEMVAREAGSGMSTGRRDDNTTNARDINAGNMYRPVYDDGRKDPPLRDTPHIVAIHVNPLYTGSNNSGSNPLHTNNSRVTGNPLYSGSGSTGQNPLAQGIAGVDIQLVNEATGEVLATTRTEEGGDFFFANVPDGQYKIKILGSTTFQKGYDVQASKEADLAGVIRQGTSQVVLSLATEITNDTVNEPQARRRVEVLKSNKTGPIGSRISQPVKSYSGTEENPLSGELARPGNPIGGIIVKGGKNPGGSFFTTTTDNNGRFELNSLKEGNYTLTFQQTIYFRDQVIIELSGAKK
ncbi:MAG: carboxypeptidase-like regulatory domain-containing protein [Chitinophagaceae bacterium]